MNEPAFPRVASEDKYRWYPAQAGMTLRDYFAAKALSGELASQPQGDFLNEQTEENAALLARRAYRFADAMLKSRTEPKL